MKIIHLSYYLTQSTPIYGGKKDTILFENIKSISNGDTTNDSRFEFPAHVGTHIDFPKHFSNSGKSSSDYNASFWVFNNIGFLNCTVNKIEKGILELNSNIEILIIKTNFGKKRNKPEYWSRQPVIPSKLASILKKRFPNLRVLGFDLISLTSQLDKIEGKKAHIEFLLKNEILILEDMDLNNLEKTPTMLFIAPLQIDNVDGVPCNVIAFLN